MQLVFEQARARWEAVTAFGEGDAPKAAGFRWDRERRRWHTPDASVAAALRAHADADARGRLDAAFAGCPAPVTAAPAAPKPDVVLTWCGEEGRFEARTKYGCGDGAKAAGFAWDREGKFWHTRDGYVAAHVRS